MRAALKGFQVLVTVLALATLTLGLSACQNKAPKASEKTAQNADLQVHAVQNHKRILNQKYQLEFPSNNSPESLKATSSIDWSKYSPQQRKDIRKRLARVAANAEKALEFAEKNSAKFKADPEEMLESKDLAESYLQSLETFENPAKQ